MAQKFMQLALTPAVQAAQEKYYGRHQAVPAATASDRLTAEETDFIAARDSFYLATTNRDGWPYIQHRGGPPGFLKVLGPDQLGFADFKGNRQLLTTGNLADDDRVALFLMDYPQRTRLKILGRCRRVGHPGPQECHYRLDGPRKCPGQDQSNGEAHPQAARLPAGPSR